MSSITCAHFLLQRHYHFLKLEKRTDDQRQNHVHLAALWDEESQTIEGAVNIMTIIDFDSEHNVLCFIFHLGLF